jgi:proteasome lid subunit RPN8/RPN11
MSTAAAQTAAAREDPAPPLSLRLSAELREIVVAHLRASLPREGCGLLAVRRAAGGAAVATRFYPGTNLDASPTRYTMDPIEVLAAFRDLEAHGWTLGAIVHSHPATPPTPSPTDLREAFYPESLMVIVSFAALTPAVRAWRLTAVSPPRAVTEVPIVYAEEA